MILSGDGEPIFKIGNDLLDKDGVTLNNKGVITPPGKSSAADYGNLICGSSGSIIVKGNTIIAPKGTYVLNGQMLVGPGGRSWYGVGSIQDAKTIVVKDQ